MHTNCPEHADFNDYTKCNFRLALPRRKFPSDAHRDSLGGGGGEEGGGGDLLAAARGSAGAMGGDLKENVEFVEIGPDTRWSVIEDLLGPPHGICDVVCVRVRVCVCRETRWWVIEDLLGPPHGTCVVVCVCVCVCVRVCVCREPRWSVIEDLLGPPHGTCVVCVCVRVCVFFWRETDTSGGCYLWCMCACQRVCVCSHREKDFLHRQPRKSLGTHTIVCVCVCAVLVCGGGWIGWGMGGMGGC